MDDNYIRTSRIMESGMSRPKRPAPPCMGDGCGFCANPIPIRPPQTQPPAPGKTARPEGETGRKDRASMHGYQPQTTYAPLAMGYVPIQQWGQTYPPAQGLDRGTIFPELDRPFLTGRYRK